MFQVAASNVLTFGGQLFRVGDMVDLHSKLLPSMTGRIVHIGQGSLEIDVSTRYNANVKEILFEDILNLRIHEAPIDHTKPFLPRI
jgi:hypothetical protein